MNIALAYDLNPSIDKHGLALNIDMNNNMLDFVNSQKRWAYFRLGEKQVNQIIKEASASVSGWEKIADKKVS